MKVRGSQIKEWLKQFPREYYYFEDMTFYIPIGEDDDCINEAIFLGQIIIKDDKAYDTSDLDGVIIELMNDKPYPTDLRVPEVVVSKDIERFVKSLNCATFTVMCSKENAAKVKDLLVQADCQIIE